MGRYYYSKKDEADSLKKIQIWWLKKNDYLHKDTWKSGGIKWTNGWTGKESSINFTVDTSKYDPYINLSYTRTPENGLTENHEYKIPLTTSKCYFGGERFWFICPFFANNVYCGKRVGVLYLGGKYFACRHCYSLSYESRNQNRRFRDYSLFAVIDGMSKEDELEKRIKRRYYAGKPTRLQRRFERLQNRLFPYKLSLLARN